jgi:hypothetical protein
MITETDNWNLLRAGATADLVLGAHVKLSLDAAYIYAWQGAVDHHLWTVVGYDPSFGTGNGVQLDAIVSYQFNDALSVGIGGRWWHLTTNAVDPYRQLETYAVDRYGVFLQGSYRFNASAP